MARTCGGILTLEEYTGTSLAVQWLRFCAPTTGGAGSILGWGIKIPHDALRSQKKKGKKKSMCVLCVYIYMYICIYTYTQYG